MVRPSSFCSCRTLENEKSVTDGDFCIVIPVASPAPFLAETLRSLVPLIIQTDWSELVLVLNGHEDQSIVSVFEDFQSSLPLGIRTKTRIVYEPEASLLAARHRGLLETKAPIVSFIDSDVCVSRGFDDGLRIAFADSRVDFATGPNLPLYRAEVPEWIQEITVDRPGGCWLIPDLSLMSFGPSRIFPFPWYWVWGLNYSVRRHKLTDAGGFNPDLGRDIHFLGDGEIGASEKMAKRGFSAGYFPELAVHHIVPRERLTIGYIASVAHRNGVSDAYTFARRSSRPVMVRLFLNGLRIALAEFLRNTKFYGPSVRATKIRRYLLGWFSYALWFATRSDVREWATRPHYLHNFVPNS